MKKLFASFIIPKTQEIGNSVILYHRNSPKFKDTRDIQDIKIKNKEQIITADKIIILNWKWLED